MTKKENEKQKAELDKDQVNDNAPAEQKKQKADPDKHDITDEKSAIQGDQKSSKKKISKTAENELLEKYDQLNDKYLRLYSEFDNFRKRTLKEKLEFAKFAATDVITSLLPVLDDFDRSLKSFEKVSDIETIKEGERLIFNKLKNILEQKGLGEMKSVGEPFNTDFHEAITTFPATSEDLKGKILDESEKGYLLNGKVIRYAKVIIGE